MSKILRNISSIVVGFIILVLGMIAIAKGNIYDGFQCVALAMILANQE